MSDTVWITLIIMIGIVVCTLAIVVGLAITTEGNPLSRAIDQWREGDDHDR